MVSKMIQLKKSRVILRLDRRIQEVEQLLVDHHFRGEFRSLEIN